MSFAMINMRSLVLAACLSLMAVPAVSMAADDAAADPCTNGQQGDGAQRCPEQTDESAYQGSGDEEGAMNQDDAGYDHPYGDGMEAMPMDAAPGDNPPEMPVAQ